MPQNEDEFRITLSDSWQRRSQIGRQQLFGPNDDLIPVTNRIDASTAAPGYVGARYRPGGLTIVSINPAGGKDDAVSNAADSALYQAFRSLRDAPDTPPLREFKELNEQWFKQMPDWTIYRQHTAKILAALGTQLDSIAYLYAVPFRTRGDIAAKIKAPVLDRARAELMLQLNSLRPSMIVSMDRMAEAAVKHWRPTNGNSLKQWFYTRKTRRTSGTSRNTRRNGSQSVLMSAKRAMEID